MAPIDSHSCVQNNELDQKQAQAQVLEGLSAGTRALEAAHSAMPLSRVESILGDASSAIEAQHEMDDLLASSSLYDAAADDSAVEQALAELDASMAAPAHGTAAAGQEHTKLDVASLPVAPSHEPALPVAQRSRRSTGQPTAVAS